MGRKAKNTAHDWIIAAFETLGDEGIDGVKVERLAKKLGTTKGSFYWHFADRPALLTAMLDFWDYEGTQAIVEMLNNSKLSANDRLIKLIEIAAETETHGLNASRVEGALRAWAGQDIAIAQRIAATEKNRIAYVTQLLNEIGFSSNDASQKAHQLYLMLLGYYSIARHSNDPQHKTHLIEHAKALAKKV